MHFYKVAILMLGLAAVTLSASGKQIPKSGAEQKYQLFNRQRVHARKPLHEEVASGRVISQDLINRFTSLKNPSTTTTTVIATTSTLVPSSPTTSTITLSPATPTSLSPTTPTSPITPTTTFPTTPTSPTPSTITSPTTTTANSTSRMIVRNQANFNDDLDNEDDDFLLPLYHPNRNPIDNYEQVEGDDSDEVNVVGIEDLNDSVENIGRAARARPSNWRRRQAQRRLQRQRQRQRRLNRRRRQAQIKARRQRRRRQQHRRSQKKRRRFGKKKQRRHRRGGKKSRRSNKRRRIVRVKV
nr:transcription initiation factor TFIID subunit 12-like [Bactrocera oleae]